MTDSLEAHDWLHGSLARSEAAINSKLASGLPFLATVGATSPFVGLLGTVIGIYRALINIGLAGSASIDKVAGPVGEALIMTAHRSARRRACGACLQLAAGPQQAYRRAAFGLLDRHPGQYHLQGCR